MLPSTFIILLLVSLCHCNIILSGKYTYHVSKSGDNNLLCGSISVPCATMSYIHQVIPQNITASNNTVEIIIMGQNENKASIDYPCTPELESLTSRLVLKHLIFTFNPQYIHSMKDWYQPQCNKFQKTNALFDFNEGSASIITFNGLIIDNFVLNENVSSIIQIYNKFDPPMVIFTNCIFDGIIITNVKHFLPTVFSSGVSSGLISSQRMVFEYCNISNIRSDDYTNSNNIGLIGINVVQTITEFTMNNCIVTNITTVDPLIMFYVFPYTMNYDPIFKIMNCHFSNIQTNTSLIWTNTVNGQIQLHISNTIFHISIGMVLKIKKAYLYLEDVVFSSSQSMNDLESTTLADITGINADSPDSRYALLIVDNTNVYMQNISVYYYITQSILQNGCYLEWDSVETAHFYEYIDIWYVCEIPVNFLYIDDRSICRLRNFYVFSDVTYESMKYYYLYYIRQVNEKYNNSFLDEQIHDFNNYNIGNLQINGTQYHDIHIRFRYSGHELDGSGTGFIINQGYLYVDTLKMFGIGIQNIFIIQAGNAYINDMIVNYSGYCNETQKSLIATCEFDPQALNIHTIIFAGGNNTRVENSVICCAATSLIRVSDEYSTHIWNTTFLYGWFTAIYATIFSRQLYIEQSTFKTLGFYYHFPDNFYGLCLGSWQLPPIFLSSKHVIIKHSIFEYYDPFGFIQFAPEFWRLYYGLDISDQHTSNISLINNTFILNPENTFVNVNDNKYLHTDVIFYVCDYYKFNISLLHNPFVTSILQKGLITFGKFTTFLMIGNTFIDDIKTFDTLRNVPWVYIGNSNDNCMTGNYFENHALNLESNSTVSSCFRPALKNISHNHRDVGLCWDGSFGTMADEYTYYAQKGDVFASTVVNTQYPMIQIAPNTYLGLYNALLDPATYQIFGELFILDSVQTSPTNTTVMMSMECNTVCSRHVNTTRFISQLYIECVFAQTNESDLKISVGFIDELISISTAYFSPYAIGLIADTQYFPGEKLVISYQMFDIYGTLIEYFAGEELHLLVTQNVLQYASVILVHSQSGNTSIYIESIDTKRVGMNYLLSFEMQNNELVKQNDIIINVTICPSGYAIPSNGILDQCEICPLQQYNLLPTIESCITCEIVPEYSCLGKDQIIITYNHWIAIKNGIMNSKLVFSEGESIVAEFCPALLCCQLKNGCSYVDDENKLCAENRNSSEPLCGSCIEGYSECYFTAACCKCTENYYQRIFIPITLVW
eukprot:259323_1